MSHLLPTSFGEEKWLLVVIGLQLCDLSILLLCKHRRERWSLSPVSFIFKIEEIKHKAIEKTKLCWSVG